MLKSTLFAAVIGALTLMFAAGGNALPLTGASLAAAVESNTTLVRDGCGPGMRYSNSRATCVPDRNGPRAGQGYGPGPGGPGYGIADPYAAKQSCQARCLQQREFCNQRKGGYFNGCGVQGAACIAKCD